MEIRKSADSTELLVLPGTVTLQTLVTVFGSKVVGQLRHRNECLWMAWQQKSKFLCLSPTLLKNVSWPVIVSLFHQGEAKRGNGVTLLIVSRDMQVSGVDDSSRDRVLSLGVKAPYLHFKPEAFNLHPSKVFPSLLPCFAWLTPGPHSFAERISS